MIALLALLIHAPVNVDLTAALGGRPLNGHPTVFVSDKAEWVFSLNEWPTFYRHDIPARANAYEGEKLSVTTYNGPEIGVHTVSQSSSRRDLAKVLVGHGSSRMPVSAVTKDAFLVLAASGGVVPIDSKTKLPRRVFALCVVSPEARGDDANTVHHLPRDDYGWYRPVSAHVAGAGIEVLLAHVRGGSAETRLEAYRISGDKLSRVSSGHYGKLDGKVLRIWESAQAARAGVDLVPTPIAVDPASGSVAFFQKDLVVVDGRKVSLANVEWIKFVAGRLYVGTRRNPDMKTLAETYLWNREGRRFELLGGFQVAGVSPNGKYWVVYFPHNGRYTLTEVRRLVP
jgi:hypothetical protein